ncbi:lipid droplet-associated hydrolase isoform X1 [Gadus morhua]|uniref:lipid droplet-associated hydrolase isoform X1 n=1 Tax=Gadus morhua TaxID=8049 RepID=UPI0011B75EB3|nr:lipid droplet-associated hydrolase isoform X1 [Gadus morhua]XP_030212947.1 lipid droplet-associated hydrolase isoform X1 [Gadus morhua]
MESAGTEGNSLSRTDFIYCCGAVTEVLRFGPAHLNHEHKVLFLVIPGNPGIVGFYKTFMQALHASFGFRHPVWAVSHAGHCDPPVSMDMVEDASFIEEGDIFGINGQIEHKLAFLRKHVPKETRLVLLGHSIGCYIILDMMKRNPELQVCTVIKADETRQVPQNAMQCKVLKAVMLFPTIERMAQTPQGRILTPALCHMRYLAYLPLFLLSLLPERLKTALVKLAFSRIQSLDSTVVAPTVDLLSGDCAANAMYMGGQEMKGVLERDNLTIKNNLKKLVFYYGAADHWCPVQYYHDIKKDFPSGDIRLCRNGFRHAFVLDTGKDVAGMVIEWLSNDLRS